jgi:hypothetical protein
MAVLSQDQIRTNIQSELADNNAGLISAYDVRHNMEDIVDSINQIVASGDFDVSTPFTGSNVRAKIVNNQYGMFIAESGISFPNSPGEGVQYEPYPGASGIQHNTLAGLTVGDPHTQYMHLNGTRVMQDNLGVGNNWINSSGNNGLSDNHGIRFQYVSSTKENMIVGSGTTVKFDADGSSFSSGKGVAQAWINFSASGGIIQVRDSYNIRQIERDGGAGKFLITFVSGVLANNDYVAMANSNARSDNDAGEDFSVNTVGVVRRYGDDASMLRKLSFHVINDAGEYVDAAMNDLVVFGRSVGAVSGVPPTVVQ